MRLTTLQDLQSKRIIGAVNALSKLPVTHSLNEISAYFYDLDTLNKEILRPNDGVALPWTRTNTDIGNEVNHIYSPYSSRSIQITGPTILPSFYSSSGAIYGNSLIYGRPFPTAKKYEIAYKPDLFDQTISFILECPGDSFILEIPGDSKPSLSLSATHFCIVAEYSGTISAHVFALQTPQQPLLDFFVPFGEVGLVFLSEKVLVVQIDSNIHFFGIDSQASPESPYDVVDLNTFGNVLGVSMVDDGSHLLISLAGLSLITYNVETKETQNFTADAQEVDEVFASLVDDPDWELPGVKNAVYLITEGMQVELLIFLAEGPGEHAVEWERIHDPENKWDIENFME